MIQDYETCGIQKFQTILEVTGLNIHGKQRNWLIPTYCTPDDPSNTIFSEQ